MDNPVVRTNDHLVMQDYDDDDSDYLDSEGGTSSLKDNIDSASGNQKSQLRRSLLAKNRQSSMEHLYLDNPSGYLNSVNKRKRAFEIINMVKMAEAAEPSGEGANFEELKRKADHNPAMVFDDQGRLLRWKLLKKARTQPEWTTKCCTKPNQIEQRDDDLYFIDQLEQF